MLPPPLPIRLSVLKGDHLHFGLWGEVAEGSLERAQEAMFELLLSFFPPAPAAVLEVGCGRGFTTALLARRGYRVVAIDASSEMIANARIACGDTGVDFRVAGFLDESPDTLGADRYDVLLFRESTRHFASLDRVFRKARLLLKDQGRVVVGDEVAYGESIRQQAGVHTSASFVVGLSENGFKIAAHRRVGGETAPTRDFAIGELSRRFDELAAAGSQDAPSQLSLLLDGWKMRQSWHERGLLGYEVLAAVKDQYFVRAYAEGDEAAIVPVFNAVFRTSRTLEHWRWKFSDNPYGSHKISEVFSRDGTLVAHFAGYPVPFRGGAGGGSDFLSLQAGDTMTAASVRNTGRGSTSILARVAKHFCAKFCQGLPFIYGFNTGHIRKLGSRYLGYEYLEEVPLWVRDVARRPIVQPPILKRLASGYAVEEVVALGPEWTDFFERAASAYGLLVKRDSQYLAWRYLACPDKVHRMFSLRRRGRLCGWGVFSQRGDRLVWGDALFDGGDPDAAETLLHAVLREHYTGIASLQGWFSPNPGWWVSTLERAGFERRPEPSGLAPCFIVFGGGVTMQRLGDSLYYTMGDSDLF